MSRFKQPSIFFRLIIPFVFLFQSACISITGQNQADTAVSSSIEVAVTSTTSFGGISEKLSICNSFTSATSIPVWYAYENRLFEKYGLDVEITEVENGSKAATAMIAGEFPICQVAGTPVSNAVIAGEDLVYIAEYYDVFLFSLLVHERIQTPEDLKGETVAITQAGSAQDTAMRLALKSLGLEPDVDVSILDAGGDFERLAVLDFGQVAGSLFSPPSSLIVREKGYHVLLDLSTLDTHYSRQGVATTREYLQSNRQTVVNLMKAIAEAIALIKKDPQGTRRVLAEKLELDLDSDASLLSEAYEIIALEYLREKPFPTREGIETVLSEIATQNPAASTFKVDEIVDESILQEIEDSGFFEQLNSTLDSPY